MLAETAAIPAAIPTTKIVRIHDRLLAAAACTLCVSAQVKFAEIQLLELLYAVDIALVCLWLLTLPRPILVFRPFFRIGRNWLLFAVFSVLLAVLALRNPFYVAGGSVLKQPVVVTFARLGELFLDVFAMVYLACRCREDSALCRFAASFYYWIGVAGCIYAIVSVIAMLGGVFLGGYFAGRMIGFNNEGGPFGVYLVSVIVTAIMMRQRRWMGRKQLIFSILLFFFCILGSYSKAALLEMVTFAILIAFFKMRPSRAFLVAVLAVVSGVTVFQATGLSKAMLKYFTVAQRYREVSLARPRDGNYIAGRVAGIFLAPKMIEAHPLSGIGLGNYPIVRDDPQYRRGSAVVALSLDSPSLGPLDYIVELGIPLFLYMTWIQLEPAVTILRRGASTGSVAMVMVLPVSLWFGAHLNITYPWLPAAIGLGMFYAGRSAEGRPLARLRPAVASPPVLSPCNG